jgi:hypothetical protein
MAAATSGTGDGRSCSPRLPPSLMSLELGES